MTMAETGAPKSSFVEGSQVLSRIEPRASQRPPVGARALPAKNPKAPLPPSIPRPGDATAPKAASNAPVATIEPEPDDPEAVQALLAAGARPSTTPPPPIAGADENEPKTGIAMPKDFSVALKAVRKQHSAPPQASSPVLDFDDALAQLQRRKDGAPPVSNSRPATNGSPPEIVKSLKGTSEPPRSRTPSIPSVKDLGKGVVRSIATPPPAPTPFSTSAPTEPEPGSALAQLGIAPIVPSTKSITAPMGALGLKPGTSPLSPTRTPSPMAIVGGASFRINPPDKPASMRPPPAEDVYSPVPLPLPGPPAPMRSSSPPPVSGSNRPPKAGGPPASYERAFRQWSSPAIDAANEAPLDGPVTFQVYTPQDIESGRRPMRSLPAIGLEPKKSSLALRVGMALVGGIIVLLTAAAVIAVSTEEPKRPAARTTASATPAAPPPASEAAPEPSPSVISIGDPMDELPSSPPQTTTPATTGAQPKPKPKAVAAPLPPASLRGIAPPPNPYGK